MTRAILKPRRTRVAVSIAMAVCVSVTMPVAGCREKANPVNPDGPPVGQWALMLRNDSILYRDPQSGHVPNDTITVRLFDRQGMTASEVDIECRCVISSGSITGRMKSRADTIRFPWGCNPPLIYWGEGDPEAPEVVNCVAIFNRDTVARATTSFYVRDRPPGIRSGESAHASQ